MSKITIDLKDAVELGADGKTFFINPEAENSIVELLDLQEQLEKTIDLIKKTIVEQGLKANPNFTGVRGDKIKTSYRHYGQPYKLVAKNVEADLDSSLYVKSVSYRPNSDGIEMYLKEEGVLPVGVTLNVREKQLSITKLNKEK